MFNNLLKRSKNKKKKGFTLIELIIVIAIIIIISAIAIPNLASVRDNAKVKVDTASCDTIKRSTLALIAGEQIAVPASTKTKTVTFKSGSDTTLTDGASAAGTAFGGTDSWKVPDETKAFRDSVKDVKAPQENGKVNYVVTIDSNGTVTVATGN